MRKRLLYGDFQDYHVDHIDHDAPRLQCNKPHQRVSIRFWYALRHNNAVMLDLNPVVQADALTTSLVSRPRETCAYMFAYFKGLT